MELEAAAPTSEGIEPTPKWLPPLLSLLLFFGIQRVFTLVKHLTFICGKTKQNNGVKLGF